MSRTFTPDTFGILYQGRYIWAECGKTLTRAQLTRVLGLPGPAKAPRAPKRRRTYPLCRT